MCIPKCLTSVITRHEDLQRTTACISPTEVRLTRVILSRFYLASLSLLSPVAKLSDAYFSVAVVYATEK